MKRRKVKLKDPTRFSVKLKPDNLKKLTEIHEKTQLDNRNMTINYIIENFHLYLVHKDFIKSIQKIIKGEI